MTEIFFINSDAVSNQKHSYHDQWIEHNVAVTSGGTEWHQQIDQIPKGSMLLLHAKNIGVVAAGTVLDEQALLVLRGQGTIGPSEREEYHRQVSWFADLRNSPVPYSEIIRVWRSNPRKAVVRVANHAPALLELVQVQQETADLETIESRYRGQPTELDRMRKARLGQGQYRTDLARVWAGKCAVTACPVEAVLRASHAKAWRHASDSERLDPNNGLLLVANLDALFDRGLISFDDDGHMICSAVLSSEDKISLGLPMHIAKSLNAKQKSYLRAHRVLYGL
ncbi:hypothetical protein GTP91_08105 [Rugamonas sp. FT82W]|uniref:HNH nuclease domain-containing protein n=1 Tax=Duganella vulcania TaxID=2692166 RepID=A0A845FYI8_9BURK|nr:HNH endonuclease [Duganella vulcania]MYM87144.1 hypothetical protein [Duganella vulcania]